MGTRPKSTGDSEMRGLVSGSLLLLVCVPFGAAQSPDGNRFPKIEIFAGYSTIETNDHTFRFSPGFNASQTDFDEGGRGFEAAVTRNLNRYLGIVGDFSAHFSHDQGPITLRPPCGQPSCPPVTQNAELNPRLFNFLAGPEIKWRNRTRLTPFAHGLFGITHTTATFTTAGPGLTVSRTDADTGFAMTDGGGIEVRILSRVSFRTSFDYSKALVGSSALPAQRVNSLGYSAGIIFHFFHWVTGTRLPAHRLPAWIRASG
jgi:opacity protein-like surface antigen